MKSYEALRENAAWVDVTGRGLIRLTGEDRARLLHAMTTNNVKALKPGEGCYAFFLNAQGRVLGDTHILCREEDFLLDTEPEIAAKIYEHLDKFIIADDVTLENLTESTSAYVLEGPKAVAVLAQGGVTAPEALNAFVEHEGWTIAHISLSGSGHGYLLFGPAGTKPALLEGVEESDGEALNVLRLEHGRPRYGEDISERFLTQETGQMQAVSFEKGCYLGQEIVERVRSRAQIHRRLMPIFIESADPPAPGTKFQDSAGKEVAEITSAAYSRTFNRVMALGYVRIDAKTGDALCAGELRATVG